MDKRGFVAKKSIIRFSFVYGDKIKYFNFFLNYEKLSFH